MISVTCIHYLWITEISLHSIVTTCVVCVFFLVKMDDIGHQCLLLCLVTCCHFETWWFLCEMWCFSWHQMLKEELSGNFYHPQRKIINMLVPSEIWLDSFPPFQFIISFIHFLLIPVHKLISTFFKKGNGITDSAIFVSSFQMLLIVFHALKISIQTAIKINVYQRF